jgi:hypothetical protein
VGGQSVYAAHGEGGMTRSPKYRRLPRAQCDFCGKIVACDIPAGGVDYVYRRHDDARSGKRCDGSRMSVDGHWVDDGHDGRPRGGT